MTKKSEIGKTMERFKKLTLKPRPKRSVKGKEHASKSTSVEDTEHEDTTPQEKIIKKKGRPAKRIRIESESEIERPQLRDEDEMVQDFVQEGIKDISRTHTPSEITVNKNQMTKSPMTITGSLRKKMVKLNGKC